MTHTRAIEQAIYYHKHRTSMTREQKVNAAVELAQWGVFSNRQIAAVLDFRVASLGAYTGKTDASGGLMKPEALPLVLNLIHMNTRGEVDYGAVKDVLDAGISARMLARLTGRPQSTLSRHARMAEAA